LPTPARDPCFIWVFLGIREEYFFHFVLINSNTAPFQQARVQKAFPITKGRISRAIRS
jgi:hypothetical protein